ncbi:MAG TPA: putative glycoside hydrolase [Acidimicrobiia bacterium]|nr:putative glycoside hydrolase [Acidimicrobiia bacterium]
MTHPETVAAPSRDPRRRPRYRLTRRGKVVFTVLPVLILAGVWVATADEATLTVDGIENDATLGAEASDSTVVVTTDAPAENLTVSLNGEPVTVEASTNGTYTASIGGLADGDHTLSVVVAQGFPFGALKETRQFSLDTTPPTVDILSPTVPVQVGEEVVVTARIDDSDAAVTIDGDTVTPGEDGTVSRSYPEPPDGSVVIAATDPVGNATEAAVSVELALAGAPGGPPMFGVHASGWTWATPELRDPILAMIDEGVINTVQLDLKDEGGDIWYDTGVALAHDVGAITELWDLEEVVADLHDRGVRVVGRIVNFRDPRLATYAVETGNMSWVIQNPDGTAYGQYGGFANPFDPDVREYNMALAEEAARLGVDDIMYDYVRRPDTLSELVYPGQDGSPEDAIISFLDESYDRVTGAGARLAAAVFGIAATRPEEVAQDIPRMAEVVDYIAPMVYPSHWGPGEYGVDNPNAQPYDITFRSLEEFVEMTNGSKAYIASWLQDFSLGIDYNEAEVRAQIQASRDAGVDDIFLWDAATTYTRAALDPLD